MKKIEYAVMGENATRYAFRGDVTKKVSEDVGLAVLIRLALTDGVKVEKVDWID